VYDIAGRTSGGSGSLVRQAFDVDPDKIVLNLKLMMVVVYYYISKRTPFLTHKSTHIVSELKISSVASAAPKLRNGHSQLIPCTEPRSTLSRCEYGTFAASSGQKKPYAVIQSSALDISRRHPAVLTQCKFRLLLEHALLASTSFMTVGCTLARNIVPILYHKPL
jgi:hypothetical protein